MTKHVFRHNVNVPVPVLVPVSQTKPPLHVQGPEHSTPDVLSEQVDVVKEGEHRSGIVHEEWYQYCNITVH